MISFTALKLFIERRLATRTCVDHYQQRKKIIHYYIGLVCIILFMIMWGMSVESELNIVKKELIEFTSEQRVIIEAQLEIIRHLESINKDNYDALVELQRLRTLFIEQRTMKQRIVHE
jgi:hypothetical protein